MAVIVVPQGMTGKQAVEAGLLQPLKRRGNRRCFAEACKRGHETQAVRARERRGDKPARRRR